MAKKLLKTIRVNLHCLISASLAISTKFSALAQNSPELLLKFLPSTYTITAISKPPFHTGHFKQSRTFFYSW